MGRHNKRGRIICMRLRLRAKIFMRLRRLRRLRLRLLPYHKASQKGIKVKTRSDILFSSEKVANKNEKGCKYKYKKKLFSLFHFFKLSMFNMTFRAIGFGTGAGTGNGAGRYKFSLGDTVCTVVKCPHTRSTLCNVYGSFSVSLIKKKDINSRLCFR
jgi:hypothetical protein